jgi:hypothetical protein
MMLNIGLNYLTQTAANRCRVVSRDESVAAAQKSHLTEMDVIKIMGESLLCK